MNIETGDNRFTRRTVVGALGLVSLFGLSGCDYVTGGSFRCKVIAQIQISGKKYTGTSVVSVASRRQLISLPEGAKFGTAFRGAAAVVPTPNGPLFFSLEAASSVEPLAVAIVDAFLGRVDGSEDFFQKSKAMNSYLGKKATLDFVNFPKIVYFRDIARPETIEVASLPLLRPPLEKVPNDVRIELEIVDDEITSSIFTYIPWLQTMSEERPFLSNPGRWDRSLAATATRSLLVRGI